MKTANHHTTSKNVVETSTYPNGFHFVHQESLNNLDICSIHLYCDVGSSYETDEVRGIAHFLEHLLFQGTTHKSATDIFKVYDQIGTEFNAYTTKRYTCFYVKCHVENAQKVMDIFTDVMKNSTLPKKHMEKEEKVIEQELRNDLADNNNSARTLFESVVYKNSSFEYPIDDIRYHNKKKNVVDRKSIVQWYKWFYRPSNMVLSVVSNKKIEFWKNMLHLSDFFTKDENTIFSIPTHALTFPLTNYKNDDDNKNISNIVLKHESTAINTHLIIGFRTTDQYSDTKHIFELLTQILNGMSGRLFTLLRQDSNIVYAAKASTAEEEFTGYFSVATEFSDKYLQQVIQILLDMFEDVAKKGITREEYDIGRSRMRGQYNMLLENSNVMTRYNGKECLLFMRKDRGGGGGKKMIPFQDLLEQVFSPITLEQINTAAKEYFKLGNMVISLVSSKKIKVSDIQRISNGYLR
jgi:predicted Zn-dependent peptidase